MSQSHYQSLSQLVVCSVCRLVGQSISKPVSQPIPNPNSTRCQSSVFQFRSQHHSIDNGLHNHVFEFCDNASKGTERYPLEHVFSRYMLVIAGSRECLIGSRIDQTLVCPHTCFVH